MIKDVINNVFILDDGLTPYLNNLKCDDPLIRTFNIKIDDINNFDTSNLDKIKEHNIIIMKINQFTDDTKKKLINFFSSSFNFSIPYILFLSENVLSVGEEDKITKTDSFYYLLPRKNDNNYKLYFKFFIKALFDKLHNIGRINSYIIDSFQTIVNSQIIEQQRNEILCLNTELTNLSRTDYLTNLLNRRAFFDALESERKRTLREHWRIQNPKNSSDIKEEKNEKDNKSFNIINSLHKPNGCFFDHYGNFSCIIIDIDHFKNINDTYGHIKGDEILKKVGETLNSKSIFRENDIIARYGGEEFVIMLPETNTFHAKIPAERLRKQVKNIDFYSDNNEQFRITISIGISEFRITDTNNEDIINRADQALYFAKENGRDQVIVYENIMND